MVGKAKSLGRQPTGKSDPELRSQGVEPEIECNAVEPILRIMERPRPKEAQPRAERETPQLRPRQAAGEDSRHRSRIPRKRSGPEMAGAASTERIYSSPRTVET